MCTRLLTFNHKLRTSFCMINDVIGISIVKRKLTYIETNFYHKLLQLMSLKA